MVLGAWPERGCGWQADSQQYWGGTLEQTGQWRAPQPRERRTSQLRVSQPESVEMGAGGLWTQEGVAQGRNGSGRLVLASQTQMDNGEKGGRGFLQTRLPPLHALMPMHGVGVGVRADRSGAEGIPRLN